MSVVAAASAAVSVAAVDVLDVGVCPAGYYERVARKRRSPPEEREHALGGVKWCGVGARCWQQQQQQQHDMLWGSAHYQ